MPSKTSREDPTQLVRLGVPRNGIRSSIKGTTTAGTSSSAVVRNVVQCNLAAWEGLQCALVASFCQCSYRCSTCRTLPTVLYLLHFTYCTLPTVLYLLYSTYSTLPD